jgi:phage terminase small subunit
MGGRGSGGKNKKSDDRRELEGNAGHRPLNKKEPRPSTGEPAMPADLSIKARIIWKQLVPLLLEMKVLTVADSEALAALCTARVRWRQAEDLVERMGSGHHREDRRCLW